jgi:hypothetical protein
MIAVSVDVSLRIVLAVSDAVITTAIMCVNHHSFCHPPADYALFTIISSLDILATNRQTLSMLPIRPPTLISNFSQNGH